MGVASYQEDNIERYVDAHWRELGSGGAAQAPIYACDICGASFAAEEQRDLHRSEVHLSAIPLLLLGSLAAPHEIRIRNGKTARLLGFQNCRRLWVARDGLDPVTYSPTRLRADLAATKRGHFRVRPDESEQEYIISVQIHDGRLLKEIDKTFVELLAVEAPRVQDIARFCELAESIGPASEYSGALADYVMGTIIKDRDRSRGATLEFDEYKVKYESARAVLLDYIKDEHHGPPVPEAVCAAIDLSLNQFDGAYRPVGIRVLDDCIRFLLRLVNSTSGVPRFTLVSPGRHGSPICPLDSGTHQVLQSFERISLADGGTMAQLLEEAEKAKSALLSEYDRSKLLAFASVGLLLKGEAAVAEGILKHLVNDFTFGEWATAQLYTDGD